MTSLTGGFVNYYLVFVAHPQREEQAPYQAECEDIIRALNMTFDEGCEFKAIWRTAAARLGNGKPGQKAKYDAEKRLHYATASLRAYQQLSPEPKTVVQEGGQELWINHIAGFPPLSLGPKVQVIVRFKDGVTMGPHPISFFDWDGRPDSERNIDQYKVFKGNGSTIPTPTGDGWFDHTTTKAPEWLEPDRMVRVRMANGHEVVAPRTVKEWEWGKDGMDTSIVAYKIVDHLS